MMGVVTGHAGGPAAPAPSQQSAAKPVPGRHVDGPAWVAIIPALITLIVTLYQIQRPSLWRDEGATLAAVHGGGGPAMRPVGGAALPTRRFCCRGGEAVLPGSPPP